MQLLLLSILVLASFHSVEVGTVNDVQVQQNVLQNWNAENGMQWWRHVRPWRTVQDQLRGGYCFKTGIHYAYELPLFISQAVDLKMVSPLGVTHAVINGSLMSLNGSSGSMYVLFYTKDGYPTTDPITLTDWVTTNEWVDFQFETCVAEEVVTAAIFIGATRNFVCADKNLECELALNVYADNLFIETKPFGVLRDPCKESNGNCPEKCAPILPLGTCEFVAQCECHYPKFYNSSTNRCELPPGRCVVPSDCPFYDSILWPGTCINTTCRPPLDCVHTYEAPCIKDDGTVRYCCQPGACCSIYGYCGIRPEYCYIGCHNGPCNKDKYCQQNNPPKLGGEGATFCCKDVPCFSQEHCCSLDGQCGSTEDNCGLQCSGGPCWNLTLCSANLCNECILKGGEYCEYNEGCKCSLNGGCPSRNRKYSNNTYCEFWPDLIDEGFSSNLGNSSYNLDVQGVANSSNGNSNDVIIAIISILAILAVLGVVMFILYKFNVFDHLKEVPRK